MGFSLYAIMQTYKDEGDDYARAEAMITACDVAGVAYIGTIVFMMLFHLSSIQPTTFELRGELSRQTAKHSAAVDREIRATVDYLTTAEQFSAFKVGGMRVTRNIYVISWILDDERDDDSGQRAHLKRGALGRTGRVNEPGREQ